ncbi:MAG: hypothetical protein H0W87_03070 [Actinobacteria bacterium]|nr:hypothetical protein [Actinomycetota bacterium]
MKKIVSLFLIGLVASFAVIAASPAGAKKGLPGADAGKGKKGLIHGVVQSVGSDSVTLKGKKGDPVTIQVNADTKIVVNGKAGALSDIQVGYRAAAKLSAPGGPAKLLRAHEPPEPGTVVVGNVDSVGSDSITLKKKDGSTITIAVNSDTKILVDGKAATLADVETGYGAYVRRTAPDGPAAVIRAYEKKQGEGGHKRAVKGIVDSVGADSITLKLRGGDTVTIGVTSTTVIRVAGKAGALSDIQAGYHALVLRAAEDGPALAIIARPPKS